MSFDGNAFRRFAPVALPLAVLVLGWMLLVRPAASANARAAQEVSLLQQRLAQVQASVAEPPPPPFDGNPAAVFERRVAVRDASSMVLEQLARLASAAPASNLLIETGDRVAVRGAGPRTADEAPSDPRFVLFDVPLTYSPISMSFDAEFASVGQLLWGLRDLATTVEVRSIDIAPRTSEDAPGDWRDGRVHVSLTLFAYARQNGDIVAAGGPR